MSKGLHFWNSVAFWLEEALTRHKGSSLASSSQKKIQVSNFSYTAFTASKRTFQPSLKIQIGIGKNCYESTWIVSNVLDSEGTQAVE